jgi:hypothetical protein
VYETRDHNYHEKPWHDRCCSDFYHHQLEIVLLLVNHTCMEPDLPECGAAGLQELFLQEVAGRAHAVMLQDEQRKGNILDYKDVGECAVMQDKLVSSGQAIRCYVP